MQDSSPFIVRCALCACSARPTIDGENVLVQVWLRTMEEAVDFAMQVGRSRNISSIDFNPVDFYNCVKNELEDFSEEKVNSCLKGMTACVQIIF